SLMPLRLARYGVPLAQTAPDGLAAAGIELPAPAAPAQRQSPALEAAVRQEEQSAALGGAGSRPMNQAPRSVPSSSLEPGTEDDGSARHLADAYEAWLAAFGFEPTSAQFARWLQDQYGIATAAGGPLSDEQLESPLPVLKPRHESSTDQDEPGMDEGLTWSDYFYNAWLTYAQERGTHPDAAALAEYIYQLDGITGAGGEPVTAAELQDYVAEFHDREFGTGASLYDPAAGDDGHAYLGAQSGTPGLLEPDFERATAGAGAQAAKEQRGPRIDAKVDEQPATRERVEGGDLTVVDRYYIEWMEYQTQHGREPSADELSAFLAEKGMLGRGRNPVSPSTLRRYGLPFRIYNVWAEHRLRTEAPSVDAVAQDCAARGITAQYNKPITAGHVTEQTEDFERRWRTVSRYHANAQ
ncbi:hypothetical protein ACWCP6_28375, partial [Streptomyces sp. NPDC002004]